MSFDLQELIQSRNGENVALQRENINPQFARVLRLIGFDKIYVRGVGQYLYDEDGSEYLDMLAGYAVHNVGRNHPVVIQALKDLMDSQPATLVQMDAPLLSGLLAERLKELTPEALDTVYFTNSGTEGVETAIKFARKSTRRPRVLFCEHSFHGLSNGSLSLNADESYRTGFDPLIPGCDKVRLNDLDALSAELKKEDVAAFVLEPVQGKGVFIAEDDYLRQARELCSRHGTALAFDEVQTGFGRTGRMFSLEHSGVEPDILIISKALSAGLVPVGAVLTKRSIYDGVFDSLDNCVVHSSTFGQGAYAMAAGIATLHVLEEEGLVENSRRMGELLLEGLRELAGRFELVKDVRGRGLMIAIELGEPASLKLKMGWKLASKLQKGLVAQAMVMSLLADHRILTQVAGHGLEVIKLIPSLVIDESDVKRFLAAFEDVLERSHRFPGPIWEFTTRLAKHALKR
ncbi:MAG: aspartate aminotransferase family protein [Planctomycetota bacterium]|nr:aspartate aminotransferase family protein [Planctomycetota bacterium]